MQASYQGVWPVGVSQGAGKGLRVHNGAGDLRPSRGAGMVPLRLRVPDAAAVQPGLQPRPADLPYPRRREEAELSTESGETRVRDPPEKTEERREICTEGRCGGETSSSPNFGRGQNVVKAFFLLSC